MAALIDKPDFRLLYQQKDVSHDLGAFLLSAAYTDHLSGEADELDLELEDLDGKWMDTWYPGKGDLLTFAIGYAGEPLLECGGFEIDEIEFSDSPSTVRIRGLAAGVTTGLRTKQHRAFEDTTLAEVVGKIAAQHGYRISGKIGRIPLDRVVQSETDLHFLKRLAGTYGYAVKLTGKTLVFTSLAALKEAPSALNLHRTDLKPGWRVCDQIRTVYQAARHKHHDPRRRKTESMVVYGADGKVAGHTTQDGDTGRGRSTNGDTLRLDGRAADPAGAEARTGAALDASNDRKVEGSFEIPGNTAARSGAILSMEGFGRLSGRWRIQKATHRLSRSEGYDTAVEFQRVDAKLVEGTTGRARKAPALTIYKEGKAIGTTSEDK